jgi:hypothetical protein
MKKNAARRPIMDWQVDNYARIQDFHFTLPYQFLLLCKLVDTPPHQLLLDFMDNLSCGSWGRHGKDKLREKLIEYFLESKYGQNYYTPEELRAIFRELDAVSLLCPTDDSEMINAYESWREKYHIYWFKHWTEKGRKRDKD